VEDCVIGLGQHVGGGGGEGKIVNPLMYNNAFSKTSPSI